MAIICHHNASWCYLVVVFWHVNSFTGRYIDVLVQKRRNSSALAMMLRLSCTNHRYRLFFHFLNDFASQFKFDENFVVLSYKLQQSGHHSIFHMTPQWRYVQIFVMMWWPEIELWHENSPLKLNSYCDQNIVSEVAKSLKPQLTNPQQAMVTCDVRFSQRGAYNADRHPIIFSPQVWYIIMSVPKYNSARTHEQMSPCIRRLFYRLLRIGLQFNTSLNKSQTHELPLWCKHSS